ncbi:MAG: GspE/PulE family protein [Erysipelotrichaceae bacterium]|nr:GspE/PulE family protein [Erysipelotrichaceae bacterium]
MAKYTRLGDLLVGTGVITSEELNKALELQKITKERLGTTLINSGIISEFELIGALQQQLGIDYVDLSKITIPTELAQLIPKSLAKQYQIVPVKLDKEKLYIAMADPMNFYAVEEVRKTSHKQVVQMIASSSAVDYAITILYGNEGAAKAIEDMRKEVSNSEVNTVELTSAFQTNNLDDDINSAPTIRLVNSIIERAVNERASDIHLEPKEKEFVCRMRIDGVMRQILTVPKELQNSVISRIKIMSSLDISERRVPQDGRFNVRIKDKDIDLRISTLPTVYGEKVVARLLDKSQSRLSKEMIGLRGRDLEKYNQMVHCHNGVILITGPTGSGKSSTMYTMINELNTESVNLVTLEDPVEYNVDGVNQVQINEKTGMTFASGLRSILRQDPDIIAVGEIRDGETAEIAMRSAITGHVVLSTIHTTDSIGTIERLIDIGVEPYLISSALKGVVAQRLVRKICPNCRKEYVPSLEELQSLSTVPSSDTKFYKGEGCSECYNTGYKGRIGVFEMLPITKDIRSLITKRASHDQYEDVLRNTDFKTLRQSAENLVREGITTVEEVCRVINEEI